MTMSIPHVTVVRFDPAYREHFARLNYAWITQLFAVEPPDRNVLDNPEAEIIARGGQIFFAVQDGRVVGTVALQAAGDSIFELAKMAVDETQRGHGYGKLLLDAALEYARTNGAKRVVLSSHTSLTPAIAMYRKAGFVERKDHSSCYSRCNIFMQKDL